MERAAGLIILVAIRRVSNMYAVIFRAKINQLDKTYLEVADRMRELAINEYG